MLTKLKRDDNVTIVQVTHSEKNASYSQRVIHLLDGRVVSEEEPGCN